MSIYACAVSCQSVLQTLPKCSPKKSTWGECNLLTILGMDTVSGKAEALSNRKQMKNLTKTGERRCSFIFASFLAIQGRLENPLDMLERRKVCIYICMYGCDKSDFMPTNMSLLLGSFHSHSHRKPRALVRRTNEHCPVSLLVSCDAAYWAVLQWCSGAVVLHCMAGTRRCDVGFIWFQCSEAVPSELVQALWSVVVWWNASGCLKFMHVCYIVHEYLKISKCMGGISGDTHFKGLMDSWWSSTWNGTELKGMKRNVMKWIDSRVYEKASSDNKCNDINQVGSDETKHELTLRQTTLSSLWVPLFFSHTRQHSNKHES